MMRKLVAVACCWAGVVTASESQLAFDVYLDDKPVGVHRVILDTSAGEKRVQVEAQFDVKFLAITAYKYRHRADEVWRNGCLVELETRTNANGKTTTVDARPAPEGLEVKTPDESATLGGCVRTFAYWDPELLRKGIHATRFHPDMPSRFGILPRYGDSASVQWFEAEPRAGISPDQVGA